VAEEVKIIFDVEDSTAMSKLAELQAKLDGLKQSAASFTLMSREQPMFSESAISTAASKLDALKASITGVQNAAVPDPSLAAYIQHLTGGGAISTAASKLDALKASITGVQNAAVPDPSLAAYIQHLTGGGAPRPVDDPVAAHQAKYRSILREPAVTAVPGTPWSGGGAGGVGGGGASLGGVMGGAAGSWDKVNEAQERVSRSGINVTNMLERMAIRMVAFGAILGAIRVAMEAFKENLNFETARVQFENMTTSTQTLSADLAELTSVSNALGISREKLMSETLALQRSGWPDAEAVRQAELYAGYAAETGEDASKIRQEMEHIRLGTGSIDEMREAASLTGVSKGNLYGQIRALEEEQALLPRITEELQRQAQLQDRAYHLQEEAQSRQAQLQERAFEAQQRNESFEIESLTRRIGASDFYRREGFSRSAIAFNQKAMEIERAQLEAKHHLEEMQHIAQQQAREDRLYQQRLEHEQILFAREDQHYKQLHEIQEQNLSIQQQLFKLLQGGEGLGSGLAKQQQTAAAAFERAAQSVKNMAGDSKIISDAVKGWASAIEGAAAAMKPFLDMMQGAATFAQQIGAALNKFLGVPSEKLKVGLPGATPEPAQQGGGFDLGKWSPFYNPSERLRPEPTAADAAKAAEEQKRHTELLGRIEKHLDVIAPAFGGT
jgi:hypothetical protein